MTTVSTDTFLDQVVDQLSESPFEDVAREGDRVVCQPSEVEEATYEVHLEDDRLIVGLFIRDRWLSESIEADLMHTGDDMEELLEEELVELGVERRLEIDHFRDEGKRFVFRSIIAPSAERLSETNLAALAANVLRAYYACFEQLGDMGGEPEE